MRKARALSIITSVVCFFTLAAVSARADAINSTQLIEKLNYNEGQQLDLPDVSRPAGGILFAEHFENNNGKHLGLSVASTRPGLKFGLFKPPSSSTTSTIPNPEPAAVLLLGTGLAAVGAYARRRIRKTR